jgi:hypothetical protein
VFIDAMPTPGEHIISGVRSQLDVEPVEFNGEANTYTCWPPIDRPRRYLSIFVHRLKGRTAHAMRHEYTGT